MAFSRITYSYTGQTTFVINFTLGYLSQDHVTARVNEEEDGGGNPVYRTITWITEGTVSISGTWESGDTVVFQRTTPKDELQHDYQDGAVLEEANLDESMKQAIMLVHEVLDGRFDTFSTDLSMGNNKITDLADGVLDTDAATLGQIGNAPAEAAAAAVSAQAALDAQLAAEVAQAAAEVAYDNFDDRYLGQKTSDPTLDNDGDALVDGALYYNTSTNKMNVYDLDTTTWLAIDTTVVDNSVTNAKLADVDQATLKGRQAGAGTGDPEDLTAAQARTILDVYTTSEVYTKAESDALVPIKPFASVQWDSTTSANKTGTYVRENLNGVWNVNVVGHGVKVGHLIYVDPTSGAAGNDFLLVTAVTDSDNFVGLGNTSGASASGNCTLPFWTINSSVGVDNVSYEQTTGFGFINLTEDQTDTDWGMFGQPVTNIAAFLQPYDVSPSGVPHGGHGTRYIRFSSFNLAGSGVNFSKNFATFIRGS